MTIKFGLLGAGRIGQTHARAVAAIDGVRIAAVCDPFETNLAVVQAMTGARSASIEEIMNDQDISAVIIATPTDQHAPQIEIAARAGKAIFCEKPIELSVERARACLEVVRETGAKLMLGFNRRFDPHFKELHRRIGAGEIGSVEMVQITSRDPSPPPISYIECSGGLFRDMMIHDLDMARFLLGEEPVEVFAAASVLVEKAIGDAGDVDSAIAILKTSSGKLVQISNSRRAVYGYDQRVEVHGSLGMLLADNPTPVMVRRGGADGYSVPPLQPFFMERYADAYRLELENFVMALRTGTALSPNGEDGLRALLLADAAAQSLKTRQTVCLAP